LSIAALPIDGLTDSASIGDGRFVTRAGRKIGWLAVAGALVASLLAYAWVDGGEEPLRDMAEPVPVPGVPR